MPRQIERSTGQTKKAGNISRPSSNSLFDITYAAAFAFTPQHHGTAAHGAGHPRFDHANGKAYGDGGIDRVTALFDSTASRVAITWEAASERTGRVELYRSVNDGRAGLLGSFDVADGRASDHQIIPGATYQYRLRIVSDDGGESGLIESNSVTLGR